MRTPDDTIVAIATPLGEAALGIVRMSGPRAIAIAEKIFTPSRKTNLKKKKGHTLTHGHVMHQGRTIDEVLLALFRAPGSYTGEDTVEIIGHGGYATLRGTLQAAMDAGARHAQPGEFTKRAFLNGKMDLSQAEAVMELISAKSDRAADIGLKQLEGGLKQWVQRLRENILDFYAPLEAAIDFPEEGIESLSQQDLQQRMQNAVMTMQELLRASQGACVERHGVSVALLGRPNAGKSSLFNALLISQRALVSAIPGTTRDVLEETIRHKGHALRLLDTAGLRRAAGKIETQGIALSLKKTAESDCLLYLIDSSRPMAQADMEFLNGVQNKRACIVVFSKTDLASKISGAQRSALDKTFVTQNVCATTAEGLAELKDKIISAIQSKISAIHSAPDIAANARQSELLSQAVESMNKALQSCSQRKSYEFLALDISAALYALGQITGETASDELLHSIFSKFCIGK